MKVNYTFGLTYFDRRTRKQVRRPRGFPSQLEVVNAEVEILTEEDVKIAFCAELMARKLEERADIGFIMDTCMLDVADDRTVH